MLSELKNVLVLQYVFIFYFNVGIYIILIIKMFYPAFLKLKELT